jgi:hypothetical protein
MGNIFSDIGKALGDIWKGVQQVFTEVISWIIPIPDVPDFDRDLADQNARGVLLNKQSNNAHIPVVYGERLIGGTRVFLEVSGTDNQYLYGAIVLCEGKINNITQIKVNDDAVTFSGSIADGTQITSNDSRFGTTITIQPFFGGDSQSASSLLSTLTNWGSNHKLSGIAYIAFRIEWDADKYTGIPNIQAKVQGKLISTYDGSSSETANQYSTNPAFILLNYLTDTRFGKAIPIANIDIPSFYTASTVCATQITPYTGASQINLIDTNVVLDTSNKIMDNVKNLLRGMRGLLTYQQGKYRLVVETTGSSVLTLNKDNVIGGIQVQSEKKNSKFNKIQATFINPEKNYQSDTIVYDTNHSTYLSEDGNILQEGAIDLPTITSPYQAKEMAKLVLLRSRNSLAVSLTANYQAMNLAVGDIVSLTEDLTGFSAKSFRVAGLAINADYTVSLSLTEHQDSFYTFETQSQVATVPDTSFPNPFTVQPPSSVTLADTLIQYNQTPLVALDITIGASPDSFVDFFQVEYKLSTDSNFIIYARGDQLNHRVLNVIENKTYDVRVKAVNTLGVSSSYVTAQRTIIGSTEPPADCEDFACNIIGAEAHLSWTEVPDLDLSHYQVRYSTLTTGAEWNNSVSLIEKVSRPATSISVPARVGSYLIKAVDKLDNFSINPAIISTNVTSIGDFNRVTIQTESPSFAGTKTNITLSDNLIRLTNLSQQGTYDFASVIDIGGVYTSRVTASITQFSENPTDLFDSKSGLFDSATGSFDGDASAFESSFLQISLSDDNVTFTDFRNFVIGDYSARYLKFRLIMKSKDGLVTPVVSALSVTIDMQSRVFSDNDIISGAGTKTVTFTNPFKSSDYALGITAEDMATGDFFVIENKSITGFDVTFKNSSDTAISRTFDFIAKGF